MELYLQFTVFVYNLFDNVINSNWVLSNDWTMVGPTKDRDVARAFSHHPVKQGPEFEFIPLLSRFAADEVERG